LTKPLVSILIPVYNRQGLVKRAIESAINQTYKNIEIIAVDNKSTDRTYEVLKNYAEKCPKVRIYQNEGNIGPVRNWKKCLEYSSGEFIKILFSDDWMEKTFVEKCMEILLAYDDAGFVFTETLIHFENNKKITYNRFTNKSGVYNTNILIKASLGEEHYPVSPCNAIFRRIDFRNNLLIEIPNELGLDFNKLGAGNDLLLFLLTESNYSKFGFINESLIHFGAQNDSITMSSDLTLLRFIAKKYFVDNFVIDNNIKSLFYSKLWLINLKNKGKFKHLICNKNVNYFKILKILARYICKKIKNVTMI
jgi:glycosyltransferase involved in cell wall biosynthesis